MTVATPLKPWSERMLQVLQDGEWHPLQKVLYEMTKTIPPQQAMNYYHTRQRKNARGKPKELHTVAQQIRAGKFGMARKVVIDWHRSGRIEIDPPGYKVPDKRVKLVPEGEQVSRRRRTTDAG